MPPTYFPTPADFRAWLSQHHASATELVVGFHKVGSGTPSMTWTESVREALCYGWIDGVRHRVDESRYSIRFTPRKTKSIWSAVNVTHVEELIAAGLMKPAGIRAFEARTANKTGVYAFEQRTAELPEPYAGLLAANTTAATFFATLPAGYRKQAVWWVVSAKREATRESRLATLIACCARGERLP
ncbi:YdeI/OmpD-associated family protein [Gemmatimonas sp.]|uniref:YdeI/OmpD-associated family protein n=1 Tax=Gemmatimonas sp. TaxID=1962908 RepID=UPI00333EF62B